MAIKSKNSGAYADIVGVSAKASGSYDAVQAIYAKAGGVYGSVWSGGPAPATIFSTYNDASSALMGFCTQPSAGRWNMANAAVEGASLAYRIKGSSASMFAFGGDVTPYRVLVDSTVFANRVVPTLAGGKIPLFTGLSDTWHDVIIWPENSTTGQGFVAPTGNLIEAYGSAAQVLPMGQAWRFGDTDFPGVWAGPTIDTTYYPQPEKQVVGFNTQTGFGHAPSSAHFRAKYDKLWVFACSGATHVMLSINGALATACALSAVDTGVTCGMWRLVDTPAQTSYAELILSGGGNETAAPFEGVVMQGMMVTGTGADVDAPTGTKRHVLMVGASQVEGVVNGQRGYRNDGHMVMNRIPIYLSSNALAGSLITAVTTAMPSLAAKYVNKDIILLSVGINSTDDANFQTDYTALIQACLTAGFTKVIARGLVQTGSNASKNAKISAAVASFGSAAVVYADVSTWSATTTGTGDSITMADGSHPSVGLNGPGYERMADYWVRDHASLFT